MKEIKDAMNQMNEQKDAILMEQLNELLSRGLLVIEETEPVFTKESDTKVIISQAVRLSFKGVEYTKKLEQENEKLRECLRECALPLYQDSEPLSLLNTIQQRAANALNEIENDNE